MHLYPLSFLEFLDASSQSQLRDFLENITTLKNIPLIFHNTLIEQMKRYFYIGGMPEAVSAFISHNDYNIVREIHQEILKSYELDFSKHAEKNQVGVLTRNRINF